MTCSPHSPLPSIASRLSTSGSMRCGAPRRRRPRRRSCGTVSPRCVPRWPRGSSRRWEGYRLGSTVVVDAREFTDGRGTGAEWLELWRGAPCEERARQLLRDELGLSPGAELVDLEMLSVADRLELSSFAGDEIGALASRSASSTRPSASSG